MSQKQPKLTKSLTKASERDLFEGRVGAGIVAYKSGNSEVSYSRFYLDNNNLMRGVMTGRPIEFDVQRDEDGFEESAQAIERGNSELETLRQQLAELEEALNLESAKYVGAMHENKSLLDDNERKEGQLARMQLAMSKAVSLLDYVTLQGSHAAQTVLKKALNGEDFSQIEYTPAPVSSLTLPNAETVTVLAVADTPGFVMDEDVIKLAKHQASNLSTAQLRRMESYHKSSEHRVDAAQITLTEAEIAWLGIYYVPMSNDFHVDGLGIAIAPNCVIRMGETKSGQTRFQLVPEKRTDVNMTAIQNRRKELLGE
jgi:hypothetical protein